MVQDPEHARKTLRNNFLSGTGLLDVGDSCVAYELLLRMQELPGHGMLKSDLEGVDKQDDGAAVRLFHSAALQSLVLEGEIRKDLKGTFIMLFVFGEFNKRPCFRGRSPSVNTSAGELFDAWLNRSLAHCARLLNAWRAFFS
jgi:hypothetical protein